MTQSLVINDKEFIVQTNTKLSSLVHGSSLKGIQSIVHSGVPGPMGPQGDPGESNIGGYPFELSSLSNNDVLAFSTDKWINKAQRELVDGGNF